MEPEIHRLDAEHVRPAVDLVRASFDADLLPYMVYGQSGIERYIEASLPRTGVTSARKALVALESGEVVGYAEFDVKRPPVAHLSYVCVAASQRGRGLARRLIARFASENRELTVLSLDVFEDNAPARTLYRQLGLGEQGAVSEWIVRPLPEAVTDPLIIEDLPQSLAVHSTFGFSSLRVNYDNRPLVLGRMGDARVRVSTRTDFLDDELLATVRGAFPTAREALWIASGDDVASPSRPASRVLARSIRMSGPLGSDLRRET